MTAIVANHWIDLTMLEEKESVKRESPESAKTHKRPGANVIKLFTTVSYDF
jgi:hypothetical protein